MSPVLRAAVLSTLFSLVVTSCGGGGGSPAPTTPITVTPPPVIDTSVPPATLNAKQGQVLLGPVVGASVEIYLATALDGATVCSVTSSVADAEVGPGVVDLSSCTFDDAKLYYFIVRGGHDIDVDDDGVLDDTPTEKKGALHAILSGAQINSGGWRVNILTELAYQNTLSTLITDPDGERLEQHLDSSAKQLLKLDLNDDGEINAEDLARFIPEDHFDSLVRPDHDLIAALLASIHDGNDVNIQELSRQYLLSAIGYLPLATPQDNFFSVEFVADDDLLYLVGYLRNEDSSFVDNHIALRIFDASTASEITPAGSLDITEFSHAANATEMQLKKSGDYLYLAAGAAGLLIIDVSQPSAPEVVGHYDTGSDAHSVTLGDSVAYVGNYFGGISIIDVADPTNPTLINTFATTVFQMIYRENKLYVYGAGILIFDVSNPNSVVLLDQQSFPSGSGNPLALRGNYLFLGSTDNVQKIRIFDISDASNIVELNAKIVSGLVLDILIEGDFLYSITSSVGVSGYSLDTYSIGENGALELHDSRLALNLSRAIAAGADVIYLSSTEQVNVYSKSALNQATTRLASIETPFNAREIKVRDGLAYVADDTRFEIYDVNEPETGVTLTGSLQLVDHIEDIAISGNYAYIANHVDGLAIIDISDPQNPSLVSKEYSLNVTPEGGSVTNTVAVVGNIAYTTIETHDKLIAFDVTDPHHPAVVSNQLPISGYIIGLVPFGDYLYVLSNGGLKIVDISDPENPTSIDDVFLYGTDLAINGTTGYMSTYQGEMQVIDFSNPQHPVLLGSATGLGQGTGIAAIGNIVYMSNAYGLINVFDATHPETPVYISQYKINGVVSDVAATDEYVFATNGFGFIVEHAVKSTSNLD